MFIKLATFKNYSTSDLLIITIKTFLYLYIKFIFLSFCCRNGYYFDNTHDDKILNLYFLSIKTIKFNKNASNNGNGQHRFLL